MKGGIKDKVREAIEPTVNELGYRIWDVTYQKLGADYHLEITIDSDEGINIDDCEKVHRAIDPILDERDFIEGFYYLEVSSPGIERELRTLEHIEACEGWNVEVKLYAARDGAKSFRGVLLPVGENDSIRIDANGAILEFEKETVAKINTYFEF